MKEKVEQIKKLKAIKELLIIVDMNNGFTKEGLFRNQFMTDMITRVNALAHTFHQDSNKGIILINEGHHEKSQEFKTFIGPNGEKHCLAGTSEAQIVKELSWLEQYYPTFIKNCTMGIFAKDINGNSITNYLDQLKNLKEVVLAGGVTDICLMEMAIPAKKYFDQNDRDIDVIVPMNVVDTYDAPWHSRKEWNEMAFRFMNQAGIKILKKHKGENYYGK